jgi:hypothetical protein
MRLRLLANVAVAAAGAAVYVALLFALLNPALARDPAAAALLPGLGLLYALAVAPPAAGLYLLYGYFAPIPLPRRWLHWRIWGGFFFVFAVGAVAVYGLNARFYRHLLPPQALLRLMQGGGAILGVALGVALTVVSRPLARRRGARAATLALLVGSWVLLAAFAGVEAPPASPGHRVELEAVAPERTLRLIGIDGLSSDLLLPLVSEGRLPAFARMMKEGAHGSLRSFPPGDEVTLWSTVLTGQKPHRHGVRGPWQFSLLGRPLALAPRGVGFWLLRVTGVARSEPAGLAHLAARGLWDLLSDFNVPAFFGGFPLAWQRQDLPAVELSGPPEDSAPDPPELEERLARLVRPSADPDPTLEQELRAAVKIDLLALGGMPSVAKGPGAAKGPRAAEGAPVGKGPGAAVVAVRLPGLDRVLHQFLRVHRPEEFGNVPEPLLERYGGTIAEYCRFLDDLLARQMEETRGRGLLAIVSPHGSRPVPLSERLTRYLWGLPHRSGEHRSGPPGLFLAWGAGTQPGRKVEGARLADLLPTFLYYLGLPVARDLDGRPLTKIFQPDFLEANPISSIPSYESASVEEAGDPPWLESPRLD